MTHKSAWWAHRLAAMLVLTLSFLGQFSPTRAERIAAESLCGNGSPPDYGFSYRLLQPHWTVGWETYVSAQTVREVDTVFDQLNDDAIAQTMILILPQDQVGIRPNCAVHFLRYMKLGMPSGERKDNGFVFLVVVEPNGIDVHYAVGLGLPALTAPELTNVNRAAEETYQSTQSMDQALLTLANEFNTVARSNYEPLPSAVQTPQVIDQPTGAISIPLLCGQICFGLILFMLFIGISSQMRSGGGGFYGPSSGSWGGSPWGGGFGGYRSRGGGRSSPSPRMRGGSGSGRSGRTN